MNYQVECTGEGTWIIKEGEGMACAYMYLLCGSGKAVLLDTGFGSIPLDEICKSLTELPIEVILTHGHFDHIGGSGLFEKVYMSPLDAKIYEIHSDPKLRRNFCKDLMNPVAEKLLPLEELAYGTEEISLDSTMGKTISFDLGGRKLTIFLAPGHTPGSICILDESRRALYTADACCKAHVLLQSYNEGASKEEAKDFSQVLDIYEDSLQKMLSIRENYDITWPCHHSIPVKTDVIEDFVEAVRLLRKGELEVREFQGLGGKTKLAEYKEIGIEFEE